MSGGFLHPWLLLAMPAVTALGWWAFRHEALKRRAALEALGAPRVLARTGILPDPRRQRLRSLLWLGGLAAALLALARPQFGTDDATAARTGRDLLVLLDLSRSMLVEDAGGSRLDQAKRIARQVAARFPGDRVGLVVFGGAAFLQLPLTDDHAALDRFLAAATPDDIDDPATDIASALKVTTTTFAHEGNEGYRAALLLTDGERSEGSLDEAIAPLRKAGIPVFAVGVGTEQGGYVPADTSITADSGSAFHLDNIGRPVVSRLDVTSLKRVTEGTLGAYAAWNDKAGLEAMTRAIEQVATRPLGPRHATERAERFQWPLALAVLLLGLAFLPDRFWRPRQALAVAAAAGLLVMPGCGAGGFQLHRAGSLYQEGKYREALDLYLAALKQGNDARVRYNAANAQYRLRRYEEAARNYREVLGSAGPLRKPALFNLGNAWVRAAEESKDKTEMLHRAVAAYEEVLRIDPSDRNAKWNLELALRALGDEEGSGSGGRGGRAQYGRGDQRNDGMESDNQSATGAMAGGGSGDAQGESAEELDPNEARRLLEQIERQQLSAHEGRPATRGQRGARDW